MAIMALNAAATGMQALSTRIDVTANNLANAETLAFKGSRVNFEDLMYVTLKQPGTTSANGEISPSGIAVGLGTKISNTQIDTSQGSLETTNRPLDVAINGNGWYKVQILDSMGGTGYTRNGNFFVNNKGELVVGTGDGYRLQPPITIPSGVPDNNITISEDGNVDVIKPGETQKTNIGKIVVTQFINQQGLKQLGGSIYTETEASGTPMENPPGTNGAGTLKQGFLEGSNVDPVKELVSLIKTQRAFELNSQSIQTADQALQTIGNLRR